MTSHKSGTKSGGRSGARQPFQNWGKLKPGKPLVLADQGSMPIAAAEEYRSIAVQVEQSLTLAPEAKIIAITGPDRTCGKSLTSLNLALVLARRGERRVVLVEGDLWRPSMRDYLDVHENIDGVGDILGRSVPVSHAIVSVWGAGLDVIFSGSAGDVERSHDRRQPRATGRGAEEGLRDHRRRLPTGGAGCWPQSGRLGGQVHSGREGRPDEEEADEDALRILGPDKTLGMILNDVKGASDSKYGYVSYLSPRRDE